MRFPARLLRSILIVLLITGSLVLLGVSQLCAQQNTVDPVFGGAGLGLAGHVTAIALQADGDLLVAGGLNGLARLNTDGTTDTSFITSFDQPPTVVALQSNGKVLASGPFTQVNGTSASGLVRLNADGSLDLSFDGGIYVPPDILCPIAVLGNGKIIVAGSLGIDSIGRLDANGSADLAFKAMIQDSFVTQIVAQADGQILLGGTFTQVDNAARVGVARLNVDGTLDGTFNPTADQPLVLLAVQADGKLLVTGKFTQIDGLARSQLARLNADGTVDLSFSYGAGLAPALAAVQPSGEIILYFSVGTSHTLGRVDAYGNPDPAFAVTANRPIKSLAVQPNGAILLGGTFSEVNGFACNSVARLNPDGNVDTSYTPDFVSGPNLPVTRLGLQANGSIIIGGPFTEIDGAPHSFLARLKSDGTPDAAFSASLNKPAVSLAVQSDDAIVVGGGFTQVDGVACNAVARLNPDGSLDTAFTAAATGAAIEAAFIVPQADGKILVAGSSNLVRLNTDGSVDTGFNVALSGYDEVNSVKVQTDGRILLAGRYLLADGTATGGSILRLNTDGSLDPSFATSPLAHELGNHLLAVQADGRILVLVNDVSEGVDFANYLIRLNTDGSLDTSFDATLAGLSTAELVLQALPQADGTTILGGSFTEVNGEPRQGLAYLGVDGSLNPFIGSRSVTDGAVHTLAQQSDGKILIGGKFNLVDGVLRNYIARLNTNGTPDFFGGGESIGNGFYYLQFPDGTPFGYYSLAGSGYSFPYIYHADFGMEYFFDANDGQGGAYLYDFASSTFFYTSPSFPFPYLYDFTLNTVLYYYPDPVNPGHYNINGIRYFYDFATGQIISK